MKPKTQYTNTLALLLFLNITAQNFTADFIKSVVFSNGVNQNPILELGKSFRVSFDDLEADQKDYKYLIEHCDYNWNKTDLQITNFLDGYNSFEINNFENSFNTYQNYTHYSFDMPNQFSRIKTSGNYLLTVLNSYDEICLQRRFVIYEPLVTVRASVKRDRNIKNIQKKQVVNFSVVHPDIRINNPKQELKISILQNNDWNLERKNLVPLFYRNNEIVYNYNEESSFYGNNEFLNFDTKNVRGSNIFIARTVIENQQFHSYLYATIARRFMPYTYFPDINGGFTIRTLNGSNAAIESEYNNVHFALESKGIDPSKDNIYVYGAFNNYAFTEENRMKYNDISGDFETVINLKQGFYNYTYVTKKETAPVALHKVSGSFQETENDYTIVVYYKPYGAVLGKVIGITTVNSKS